MYDEKDYLDAVTHVYGGQSKKSGELCERLAKEAAMSFKQFQDVGALRMTFEKHGRFASDVMELVMVRFPQYSCTSCGRKVVMEKLDDAEDINPRCIYCSKGKLKLVETTAEGDGSRDDADSEASDGPRDGRVRWTRSRMSQA